MSTLSRRTKLTMLTVAAAGLLAAVLTLELRATVIGAEAMRGGNARAEAAGVTVADMEAIRAAALDYVDGYYEGSGERMARAVHPALAKRIVAHDRESGRAYLQEMGASALVNLAAGGSGRRVPEAERQRDVEILDVFGNTASVRATMHGWIDYMHIAKYDDRWVIVNVLWEQKPREE